jgi:glyoxalase family protein
MKTKSIITPLITGIHHVTAIAGNSQENLDFYTGVLGLRLVKRSVNQDDPGIYHLFYADAEGHPGSDLTFFPWTHMTSGQQGVGLIIEVPLTVPIGSLDYWLNRLTYYNVAFDEVKLCFDEKSLSFRDPHGLKLSLVESNDLRDFTSWQNSPVPEIYQIRGIHGVKTYQVKITSIAQFLITVLGFKLLAQEDNWYRFGIGGAGSYFDVFEIQNVSRGKWGVGSVHHVAWRVTDIDVALQIRKRIIAAGLHPTEVIDRFWFKSIYFFEPGGVLFELATDGPGFAIDEDLAKLGEQLILPPWLESQRAQIEAVLPPLKLTYIT